MALEDAARRGEALGGVEVLLDELEARGALGQGERITELRGRLLSMVRLRGAIWAEQPETTIVDVYARTLDIPELAGLRREWDAALDARGPWLRPLRPWVEEPSVLAELRAGGSVALDQVLGLRFEGEDLVVLGLRGEAEPGEFLAWSWARGQVEPRVELEPVTPRYQQDPRFERGEDAPVYRARPGGPARQLPWEDFGHANAKMSADGRTIFVYGWFDDNYGRLELVDERSLEVLRRHDFDRPVAQVVERAGSDDLLVETYGGLFIVNGDGRQWHRPRAGGALAWSPSGRYVCTVDARAARLIDVRANTEFSTLRAAPGLPTSFSPDGTRLVDGPRLLDGRSGALVAHLEVRLGEYLMGGPASPWWHVRSELILNIHSGLQVWDARTGEAMPVGEGLRVSSMNAVAYSASGRELVHGRRRHASVVTLPDCEEVAALEFGMDIEAVALADSGHLVAAFGGARVELRQRDGSLLGVGELPQSPSAERGALRQGRLRLDLEHRQLRIEIPERTVSGWSRDQGSYTQTRPGVSCAWSLDSEGPTLTRIEPAGRAGTEDWTVEDGAVSTFVDASTDKRLAVPCAGPWVVNPGDPRLFACPDGLFELRLP